MRRTRKRHWRLEKGSGAFCAQHLSGRSGKRLLTPFPTGGFTLVEMMVTMAISLIIIFALAQAFAFVGENVTQGRAAIEMAGSLRSVSGRLFDDLEGLTVRVEPWVDESAEQGYFEYFEGIGRDLDPLPKLGLPASPIVPQRTVSTAYGDIDDILAFTARSTREPFRGYDGTGNPISSYEAEVIWFTRFDDRNGDGFPGFGEVSLYRRVLLILPSVTVSTPAAASFPTDADKLIEHYRTSDVSVRVQGGSLVPNTLASLTRRENRFAHRPDVYPYLFSRRMLVPRGTQLNATLAGFDMIDDDLNGTTDDPWERGWFGSNDTADNVLTNVTEQYGNDVILSDLLAFDVKCYDPSAEVRQTTNNESVVPGDPGWSGATFVGRGAFVDLGYRNTSTTMNDNWIFTHTNRWPGTSSTSTISVFSGLPVFRDGTGGTNNRWDAGERFLGIYDPPSGQYAPTFGVSYCTWSAHYERDGVDQDNDGLIDEGTNGLDDNNNGLVDEPEERETSPPYPVPLRGIEVRIRMLEPGTLQVREVQVVKNLTQE